MFSFSLKIFQVTVHHKHVKENMKRTAIRETGRIWNLIK